MSNSIYDTNKGGNYMKKVLKWVGIAFVVLIIIGVVAGGGNETAEKVESTDETTTETSTTETEEKETDNKESEKEEPPKTEVFNIGDNVQIGDVIVTVNSVRENSGNDFIKPSEGNVYYIVDLTIENQGSEAYSSSTLMQMSLADEEGYQYNITVGPETKGSVDGEIGAGRKVRGEVVFEIPKESKGLEFVYDYDILGTGQVIVKLSE